VAALVAVLTGCVSGSGASQPADDRPVTASSAHVTKLLVVVVENHSLEQMQAGMPWLNGLAQRYGYAADYHAIRHPSLPNYLAIAGGSTFGVANDAPPAQHRLTAPSVFGRALLAHRTATTYAEGMGSNCQLVNHGRYAVRHNPWTYFRSEHALCLRNDVPLTRLRADVTAGRLPNIGMVIPDVCNDAHNCSLSRADAWMRRVVGPVLNGPDFASGHLAVVVTADEDDRHHGNRVLTVVAHPALHHQVVHAGLTHYALSRSYAEAAGIAPLLRGHGAPSLLRRFGLR
jgi:acid phosphatase